MGLIVMKTNQMNSLKKVAIASSAGLAAFLSVVGTSFAQFSTSSAAEVVTDVTTNVGSILAVVLVSIAGLLAALIGLGMGVKYFKRWIGRK